MYEKSEEMISFLCFSCLFIVDPETAPQLNKPLAIVFFVSALFFFGQVQVHVTPRDCRNKAHSVAL